MSTKFGESSRSLYERNKEHYDDLMWKKRQFTCRDPGVEPNPSLFVVKVISQHKSSLIRQIKETMALRNAKKRILIAKYEYTRCTQPASLPEA